MSLKPEELTQLFTSLSAEQQEAFSKIVTDFVAASAKSEVVPMLFAVPKSTLNSPLATLRIPTSALTPEAAKARNLAENQWQRDRRENMSEDEKEVARKKDADRKRAARAKAKSSDPSP